MTSKSVPLGSDPEFFITDKKGNLISIIGRLGGTKENPKALDDNGQFRVQEDNVAAEYNIPPSYTKEQFVEHILWPQQYLKHLFDAQHVSISNRASASFPPKELEHPKAQEFGCDPDFNAWQKCINEKPVCDDPTFRTCGGHVHFGVEDKDPDNITRIIRAMDKYLGIWSVLVDKDQERRKLYGKAGCFRFQPHGGEYRTLSNFWIFDEALIKEVWDRAQQAMLEDYIEDESTLAKQIQYIINSGDVDAAKAFSKINRL